MQKALAVIMAAITGSFIACFGVFFVYIGFAIGLGGVGILFGFIFLACAGAAAGIVYEDHISA